MTDFPLNINNLLLCSIFIGLYWWLGKTFFDALLNDLLLKSVLR